MLRRMDGRMPRVLWDKKVTCATMHAMNEHDLSIYIYLMTVTGIVVHVSSWKRYSRGCQERQTAKVPSDLSSPHVTARPLPAVTLLQRLFDGWKRLKESSCLVGWIDATE